MSITSAKYVACAFVFIGAITLGSEWPLRPAAAGTNGSNSIALQASPATSPALTFVVLLDDDRDEGGAREGDRERRDGDVEGDRERPRREGDQGRDAAGPRREGDQPREREARREGDRPREGDALRETFRPRTDNEAVLYRMIVQLQREVAELRDVLRSRGGDARREVADREREEPRRDRDQPRREDQRPREHDGDRAETSREGTREAQSLKRPTAK